ncbi:hypothetical protein [Lactococcus garvieae]|uniref:hypothetical protein n=1 Tax=Lactococcus garvieae TaxID=1363 RepID=UPI0002E9329D|nr:hypothetical protein [Lactococcus garvieae]
MAKYEHFTLNLKNGEILNLDQLREVQVNLLHNGNLIYIYRSSKNKKYTLDKQGTL